MTAHTCGGRSTVPVVIKAGKARFALPAVKAVVATEAEWLEAIQGGWVVEGRANRQGQATYGLSAAAVEALQAQGADEDEEG